MRFYTFKCTLNKMNFRMSVGVWKRKKMNEINIAYILFLEDTGILDIYKNLSLSFQTSLEKHRHFCTGIMKCFFHSLLNYFPELSKWPPSQCKSCESKCQFQKSRYLFTFNNQVDLYSLKLKNVNISKYAWAPILNDLINNYYWVKPYHNSLLIAIVPGISYFKFACIIEAAGTGVEVGKWLKDVFWLIP